METWHSGREDSSEQTLPKKETEKDTAFSTFSVLAVS